MKILSTLEEYWSIPLAERRRYSVGEELSTSYPINDTKEQLISVPELFKKHGIQLLYEPPKEIAEIDQELLLRETAAIRLLQAAKILPRGYIFKVSEGYRPLWFQKMEFDRIFSEMKKKYPRWPEKRVWEETTMYIADPELSPPHSSGGTFDLTIADVNGVELNMGNPLNSVDTKSHTFSKDVKGQQRANRMLLFALLTDVGFVNIPSEWWHYSYGDQYWAIYHQKPHALYGKVDTSK